MKELTKDELQRIFELRVRPFLFDLDQPLPASTAARFVSVGGQPGAGKSAALRSAEREIPEATVVNGDELRQFHPEYTALMKSAPLDMPSVTASAAGQWVGMSNEYARQTGRSVIVETTLRQPDLLAREFSAFKEAGFDTELRVVAVPLAVSREGILNRYLEQVQEKGSGRWTPGAHHDVAAEAGRETVRDLVGAGLVDHVVVQGRDQRVYLDTPLGSDARTTADQAVAALDRGRSVESLTQEQAQQWLARMEQNITWLKEMPLDRQSDILAVAQTLVRSDAPGIVSRAFDDVQSQRQWLHQWSQAL